MKFIADLAEGGGYCAEAADLSIFTEADTFEELELNIVEAITCHFDGPIYPTFKLIFT